MNNHSQELQVEVQKCLGLPVLAGESYQQVYKKVYQYVAQLLAEDVNLVISLLYRLDVDEYKIKECLAQQEGQDTAGLLTNLIIDRQVQKIAQRNMKFGDSGESQEERW